MPIGPDGEVMDAVVYNSDGQEIGRESLIVTRRNPSSAAEIRRVSPIDARPGKIIKVTGDWPSGSTAAVESP